MVTEFDPDIEAMGFDKMRSSIHIEFEDGHTVSGDADERYRGGPENPLTLEQLQDKVRSCCEGVLNSEQTESLIEQSQQILEMDDAAQLAGLIQGEVANKLKVAN
jgi:2-methylcitrate dehydratase PrpD